MIKRGLRWWPSFLLLAALLAVWEAAVRFWSIDPWMLPAPSQIAEEWNQMQGRLWPDIEATAWIATAGLALGVFIGLVFAIILHLSPFLKQMVYPLLVLSQNVPMIALAPLLVMWFGFGDFPKMLVVILICFFPVTVSTLDGLAQTDRTLRLYMQMAGASRWQLFTKLEWPSALPSFFSGLKLAATYSMMGAVIAEWLGAQNGLGLTMQMASTSFRTDRVFVVIGLVVGLSLLFFALITLLENRVIHWKRDKGGNRGEA